MQSNKTFRLRLALTVVLTLVFFKFVVLPMWSWREGVMQQVVAMDMKVKRKRNLVANADEMDDLLAEARTSSQQATTLFHTDFSDAQALQLRLQKRIEDSARQYGIEVQSINWLHVSGDDIIKVPVNIRFETTPEKMYQLIAGIENSKYFVTIERLRVDGGSNRTEVRVDLDASAYGIKKALDNDPAEK